MSIKYESDIEGSDSEEEREQLFPEDEQHNLIIRRSFHTT